MKLMSAHKRSSILLSLLFCTLVLTGQSILNPLQQQTPSVEKDSIAKSAVQPIPLTEINSNSTGAFQLFARIRNSMIDMQEKDEVSQQVETVRSEVRTFLEDTLIYDLEALSFREMENLNTRVQLLEQKIYGVMKRIESNLSSTQESITRLNALRSRWQMTKDVPDFQQAPDAIRKRVNNIIGRSDSINMLLQSDIDFLLTQADRLTDEQIRIEQFDMDLTEYKSLSGNQMFKPDVPPLWIKIRDQQKLNFSQHIGRTAADFKQDSSLVVSKYLGNLAVLSVIFIFLLVVVYWIRGHLQEKNLKARAARFDLYLREIFLMPVEVALILALYLVKITIPDLPNSYRAILSIIAIYPIIRLSMEMLSEKLKKYLIELTVAYFLMRVLNVVYDESLFSRIILLFIQVLAIFFLIRFILQSRVQLKKERVFVGYLLQAAGYLFTGILFLSFIGNIVGVYGLSEYLTNGIIQSSFLILTTYVGFHVLAALVYLLLSSKLLQKSNIVKQQFRYLFKKIFKLLRILFIFSWFYIALDFFNWREVVFGWIGEFLSTPLVIGKATFSLMSVILFIFVLWLSIFISRIVRYILHDEVFARIEIKRGIPGTIIMLVRIGLVSIGFFLAAAAAGIKLSNLTIIIGAFSVGIGFGLQNIFNNLVSGLILVFERPIKEGDTVEVNSLLGEVKKIGIRSSIVRTFDGAEVIVPNGSLISNDLINWSLSDAFRRVDIRVGVAYGTDPEIVINLLHDAAAESEITLPEPSPKAYFLGFGDSSLDFRLLAWAELGTRLELESELKVTINRKLKESGIEIPFPQRDLHIRSVDPTAGKHLTGQKD